MSAYIGALLAGLVLIVFGVVQFERNGGVNRAAAVIWIGCVLLALALTLAVAEVAA